MRNFSIVLLIFTLLVCMFSCSKVTENPTTASESTEGMTEHTMATTVSVPQTESNAEKFLTKKAIETTSESESEMRIDLLQEYSRMIKQFPVDNNVGIIESKEDAIKVAEEIWLNKYGGSILEKKPYITVYDERNEVWLVRGALPMDMYTTGGVPFMLVRSSGEVLAVWHDK